MRRFPWSPEPFLHQFYQISFFFCYFPGWPPLLAEQCSPPPFLQHQCHRPSVVPKHHQSLTASTIPLCPTLHLPHSRHGTWPAADEILTALISSVPESLFRGRRVLWHCRCEGALGDPCFRTPLQARPGRPRCSWLCPPELWTPLRMEIAHLPWVLAPKLGHMHGEEDFPNIYCPIE